MKFDTEHVRRFALGVEWVEPLAEGWRLHRMPAAMESIYGASGGLRTRVNCTSGVRLRFLSDTRWIRVRLQYGDQARWYFACVVVIDGTRSDAFGPVSRQEIWDGLAFSQVERAPHVFDLWLPHLAEVRVLGVEVEDGCQLGAAPACAFRWLAFGDSILQGMNASLPIFAWPARVGLKLGADVINMGVGGATLSAELAGVVPEGAADLVSVGYGANDWNIAVPLAQFRANAVALLDALRRRFAGTPIVVSTPIHFFRATGVNTNGDSLDDFRRTLEAVALRPGSGQAAGRVGVFVVRGLELVPADHAYFNDWSHPNDAGMEMIAGNWIEQMKRLGVRE